MSRSERAERPIPSLGAWADERARSGRRGGLLEPPPIRRTHSEGSLRRRHQTREQGVGDVTPWTRELILAEAAIREDRARMLRRRNPGQNFFRKFFATVLLFAFFGGLGLLSIYVERQYSSHITGDESKDKWIKDALDWFTSAVLGLALALGHERLTRGIEAVVQKLTSCLPCCDSVRETTRAVQAARASRGIATPLEEQMRASDEALAVARARRNMMEGRHFRDSYRVLRDFNGRRYTRMTQEGLKSAAMYFVGDYLSNIMARLAIFAFGKGDVDGVPHWDWQDAALIFFTFATVMLLCDALINRENNCLVSCCSRSAGVVAGRVVTGVQHGVMRAECGSRGVVGRGHSLTRTDGVEMVDMSHLGETKAAARQDATLDGVPASVDVEVGLVRTPSSRLSTPLTTADHLSARRASELAATDAVVVDMVAAHKPSM